MRTLPAAPRRVHIQFPSLLLLRDRVQLQRGHPRAPIAPLGASRPPATSPSPSSIRARLPRDCQPLRQTIWATPTDGLAGDLHLPAGILRVQAALHDSWTHYGATPAGAQHRPHPRLAVGGQVHTMTRRTGDQQQKLRDRHGARQLPALLGPVGLAADACAPGLQIRTRRVYPSRPRIPAGKLTKSSLNESVTRTTRQRASTAPKFLLRAAGLREIFFSYTPPPSSTSAPTEPPRGTWRPRPTGSPSTHLPGIRAPYRPLDGSLH